MAAPLHLLLKENKIKREVENMFKHHREDKTVYSEVLKYARTHANNLLVDDEFVEKKMDDLLNTYGYTVEYDRTRNMIYNMMIQASKKKKVAV